jgi:hypothetical protein
VRGSAAVARGAGRVCGRGAVLPVRAHCVHWARRACCPGRRARVPGLVPLCPPGAGGSWPRR